MEAAACKKVIKELTRIADKLQRAISQEESARKKDLAAALEYESEREIQDAYGFDCISEAQYELYQKIFEEGQQVLDSREKTVNELALSVINRILADISEEQKEWEFSALSPKDQAAVMRKVKKNQESWKKRIAELKAKKQAVDSFNDPMNPT